MHLISRLLLMAVLPCEKFMNSFETSILYQHKFTMSLRRRRLLVACTMIGNQILLT
jgi:hypothetical protein